MLRTLCIFIDLIKLSWDNYAQLEGIPDPADTDVFKTSSGRLRKVTTSYDQTRRRQEVWKKTSYLRRLEDIWFTTSSGRLVYDVLKTSDLRRLEDV